MLTIGLWPPSRRTYLTYAYSTHTHIYRKKVEIRFLVYMYVCAHMHAHFHVCPYVWAEIQSTASSVVPQALPIFSETGFLTFLISRQVVSQGLPISAFLATGLQASSTMPRPFITYLKKFKFYLLLYLFIYFKFILLLIYFINYLFSIYFSLNIASGNELRSLCF